MFNFFIFSVGVRPLPGGSETSWMETSDIEDIRCYTDILHMLVRENEQLKSQLDDASQKIAKSHKVIIFHLRYKKRN